MIDTGVVWCGDLTPASLSIASLEYGPSLEREWRAGWSLVRERERDAYFFVAWRLLLEPWYCAGPVSPMPIAGSILRFKKLLAVEG